MPPVLRSLLPASAIAGLFLLIGCQGELAEAECGPDALGISRTVMLTPDSPPPYELLKENEVILTFDDGPAVFRTKAVLKVLAGECTQATFFLLGDHAQAYPGLARTIRAAGHSVGSHTVDHANLTQMTIDAAVQDALNGKAAVDTAIGQPTPLFRFPFVATTPELSEAIKAAGLIDVTVTVDGEDWTNNTPEAAVDMILAKLEQHHRRGMILLHDPVAQSAERTRYLLRALKEHGYHVVALEQPEG